MPRVGGRSQPCRLLLRGGLLEHPDDRGSDRAIVELQDLNAPNRAYHQSASTQSVLDQHGQNVEHMAHGVCYAVNCGEKEQGSPARPGGALCDVPKGLIFLRRFRLQSAAPVRSS